jgi:hypothetical protein
MTARMGLGAGASVDAFAAQAGALVGLPTEDTLGLLRDAEPADDRDLVRLSDALLDFERRLGLALGGPPAARAAPESLTATPPPAPPRDRSPE